MTVSSTNTRNSYSGNGSTTVFAYTFKIFDDDDITVILRDDATAAESTQTKTTHYTVSGVGDAGGGNITFGTAPASGKTVVLIRSTPLTQITDYTPNDPFPAESHEDALDKLTFITQELQEEIGRAIKVSQTNEIATAEFTVGAAARANKVLGFDGSGDLTVLQEIGIFRGTDATVTTVDYDARDLVKSTTTAQLNNVYIALQDSPTGTALTNTTYWALIVDAVSAATSATAAASSASAASTSETNASNSESAAATSASASATSATASAASATAAAQAEANTLAAYDNFDDRYLGAKSSDPTQDNDGDALVAGSLYFNTTDGSMKVYTGSAWVAAYISGGSVLSLSGGTMTGNIVYSDDVAAVFGDDSDLTIVHDSGGNNNIFKADSYAFRNKANSNLTMEMSPGATKSVTLYHQGSEKLAVRAGGILVTGAVSATSVTGDGSGLTNLPATGDGGIAMAIALG